MPELEPVFQHVKAMFVLSPWNFLWPLQVILRKFGWELLLSQAFVTFHYEQREYAFVERDS